MSQHVATSTGQGIATVELTRPDKKNALTAEMYAVMADALAAAERDAAVRAVLIHGSPACFTAGNDLLDFMQRPPGGGDAPVFQFLGRLARFPKPLVAAVAGPAVGIGTTLLLHCDLVYAAPNARFQLPFVPLGLVPEAGSSLLLPLLAGHQRAAELLLLGRPFGVEKAIAAGFVNECVAEAELLAHARTAALALAALPAESVRLTKELLKRTQLDALSRRMADEAELFRARLASPEAAEAMTAFFEKRAPDFSKRG